MDASTSAVAYRVTTEGESTWRREARERQTKSCLSRRDPEDVLVDQAEARHRAAIARAGLRHRPVGEDGWRSGKTWRWAR